MHTSLVVFAFAGNALITSSMYVVQRTCRTRLFGGNLAWFVIWGYQLFLVMAASGYLHHLLYTALPDWAQTLGMVFSIVL